MSRRMFHADTQHHRLQQELEALLGQRPPPVTGPEAALRAIHEEMEKSAQAHHQIPRQDLLRTTGSQAAYSSSRYSSSSAAVGQSSTLLSPLGTAKPTTTSKSTTPPTHDQSSFSQPSCSYRSGRSSSANLLFSQQREKTSSVDTSDLAKMRVAIGLTEKMPLSAPSNIHSLTAPLITLPPKQTHRLDSIFNNHHNNNSNPATVSESPRAFTPSIGSARTTEAADTPRRPSSASALRNLVDAQRSMSSDRETIMAERNALQAQAAALAEERARREAARKARAEARERKRHQLESSVGEPVDNNSSSFAQSLSNAEHGGGGECAIVSPSAVSSSCLSPCTEAVPQQQQCPVDVADDLQPSSISAEEEASQQRQREEAEHAAEVARIKAEAQLRREARLRAEAEAADHRLAEEAERRRAKEIAASLQWDEQYERQQVATMEQNCRRQLFTEELQRYTPAMDHMILLEVEARIYIFQDEHECRTKLWSRHFTNLAAITAAEVIDEESMNREVLIDWFEDTSVTIFISKQEQELRPEIAEHWQLGLKPILQWFREVVVETVSRELWLVVVAEAEARMVIEQDEREGLLLHRDGHTSSRSLVLAHAKKVEEARQATLAFFAARIVDVVESELAQRLLLRRQEHEASSSIVEAEGEARAPLQAAMEAMRRAEVEQAIRAAQIFQEQQKAAVSLSSEIAYKQVTANNGNTNAKKPTGKKGKR